MTARRPDAEEPAYRPAREDDRAQLSGFDCSTGLGYENEVESYVQNQALDFALDPEQNYTLLVFIRKRVIVAVSGFYPEVLVAAPPFTNDAMAWRATRLSPVAIRTADQGSRCASGRQLSDLVVETTIARAMAGQSTGLLNAIVDRDNARSIALCERHGLTSRTGYDGRYDRLSGLFHPL